VGTWRVWVSQCWINPGNIHIPPTINLGSLQCMCGKGNHKYRINDSDRLHMFHDNRRNVWKSCHGVVYYTNNNACHIVNTWLILPQISRFACNQSLIGFVWILQLIHIYIRGQIQSLKGVFGYVLGCQPCMPAFVLLLGDNTYLLTLRMLWLLLCRSRLSCCGSFPSVDVKEPFDDRMQNLFWDGCWRGSSFDSKFHVTTLYNCKVSYQDYHQAPCRR